MERSLREEFESGIIIMIRMTSTIVVISTKRVNCQNCVWQTMLNSVCLTLIAFLGVLWTPDTWFGRKSPATFDIFQEMTFALYIFSKCMATHLKEHIGIKENKNRKVKYWLLI